MPYYTAPNTEMQGFPKKSGIKLENVFFWAIIWNGYPIIIRKTIHENGQRGLST
jgi:hypothetical protein|tara:strand:+ start:396 stop:557 length:162 start_codon:yes stop_codon:yes gene_type:complete